MTYFSTITAVENTNIHSIKELLISVGRFDLFNTRIIENPASVKRQISETLVDLHTQDWHQKVNLSSKGKNYYLYKQNIKLENYLVKLNKKQDSELLKLTIDYGKPFYYLFYKTDI